MNLDMLGERTIIMSTNFTLEMTIEIAKKFKFQLQDDRVDLLRRHLNHYHFSYVHGTEIFYNLKRPSELKKHSEQFIFHCEKLISLIKDADIVTRTLLQHPTKTQDGLNLTKLSNDLELFLSRAKQQFSNISKDNGGVKETDRAFKELIGQLISGYALFSKSKPIIVWNRSNETYQGEVYCFIKEYLEITKIPMPIKNLGKYISRIISNKKSKVVLK